ncbi:MAG TPA: RnfABCDGE type electron transport complex subunit B [Caldithrix abyssi]|uniref:Ion-translocating oxidoreductase complex subunit B n=1 Tax=Caldithrix abyssi TaxID=187145 RepID=A0A7V5H3D3_CALAY|nr:RnfABCDGE type electron transport complex subunit B [Caldisericaceae bacterium]HHE55086.1 RnfABCDGE type electron transport complex subunit B [Caldithrix abyssi]
MVEILLPGFILAGFALISASGLYLASKKFYVYEDPRIDEVEALLPGANCGGCGYAGCRALAEHIVNDHTVDTPCPVAEPIVMEKIADLLGLEASVQEKQVATLLCKGTHENSALAMDYRGIQDCWAAVIVADSIKDCAFACLGLGSCVQACNFDAMRIENGIVVIDEEKCTGCGICISHCPKNLLVLRPVSQKTIVTCSNTDRGPEARKACKVACIGCMKCQKVCQHQAIYVEDFLARIDFEKCTNCGDCVEACPTNAIEMRGEQVYVTA